MQHDVNFTDHIAAVRGRFLDRLNLWLPKYEDFRDLLSPPSRIALAQLVTLPGIEGRMPPDPFDAAALDALRTQTHKIAGSALTFGFADLSGLAQDLEYQLDLAACEPNDEALALSLDRFISALKELARAPRSEKRGLPVVRRPDLAPAEIPAEVDPGPVDIPSGSRAIHVLVVDDDDLTRDLLRTGLGAIGWRVTEAVSGVDAILTLFGRSGALARERPDIVLMDVNMPGMDGFSALDRIKGSPLWHHIPVIMLTRRSEDVSRIRGLRGGADDYLLKPFGLDTVIRRITNLLAGHSRPILVGCSDPARGAVLARRLKDEGRRVRLVHDTEAAWNVLSAEAPSVAMIDADLNGDGGIGVLMRARARHDTANIPILIGMPDDDTCARLQCLMAGAEDCVSTLSPLDYMISRIGSLAQTAKPG